ncbi:hypothetical protein POM88_028667 [Heracleum sosnowskyi]|uniref:DUF4283 domain-containing protein n=1 Tax=Heracleum sosnowskyi TaxID=360622 RepID=A0AAD8HS93_9APIA|nr:hypothetical protein POM88_028667 [Heracleum sosnowskyi]
MGSQDSNVDLSGVPVDQEGFALEFGVFSGPETPFAVVGDVLQEILRDEPLDEALQHFEADPVGDFSCERNVNESVLGGNFGENQGLGVPSSSGGIPVEQLMEESSEEEFGHEDARARLERESVNRDAKAAFAVNRDDRNELISLRLKYQEMQRMLAKKGISLVDLEKEALIERVEFNSGIADVSKFISGRDEFGLPKFTKASVSGVKDVRNVFEDLSDSVHIVLEGQNQDNSSDALRAPKNVSAEEIAGAVFAEPPKATWSQVVKKAPVPTNNLSFDYVPMPPGVKVVSPPNEVLRKGNEKLKSSIVGTFTRGAPPFSKVAAFAHSIWDNKGLIHISQKDPRTYISKFNTVANMNSALSKGTWYLEKKPMLVHAWGSKAGEKSSMPLWVKFENIPDCYWTRDGLSFLGSVIGNPLSADDMTSKLEVLPFAKLCVDYKIGDELPTKIEVEVLDPITELKHIEEVKVSYPLKPLVCSACKSLGHIIGACPNVTRQWVRKDVPPVKDKETVEVTVDELSEPISASGSGAKQPDNVEDLETGQAPVSHNGDDPVNTKGEHGWTTVQSKKSKLSPSRDLSSHTSLSAALKLPIYSAISKSLNKGKNKKVRRFEGTRSPSH